MEAMDAMSSLSIVQHRDLAAQVSTTMMKKSLDMAKFQGQAMVDLIETAGQVGKLGSSKTPGLGQNLDIKG